MLRRARFQVEKGRITRALQAVVDEEGRVTNPVILSSSRKGVGFEVAALHAVLRWRYEPATSNGVPVPVYFTIVVTFGLNGYR